MYPNPRPISQQSSQPVNQGIDYLLEQYPGRIRYLEAQNLINESRRKLGMSRIEPWNKTLQKECDRRMLELSISSSNATALRSSSHPPERKQEPQTCTNKLGTPDRITTNSIEKISSSTSAEWNITRQPSLKREMMDKQSFSLCVKPTVGIMHRSAPGRMTPSINDSETGSTPTEKDNRGEDLYEPTNETKTNVEKKAATEHAGKGFRNVQSTHSNTDRDASIRAGSVRPRKYEIVQVDELLDDSDDDDVDEFADDDCSQNTDNSKCFTTLKELARDEPRVYLQTDDNDNSNPCYDENEDDDHAVVVDKFYNDEDDVPRKRYGDSSTVGTGEESEPGIPMLITIRWRDPPEVPSHEPLGECYLVPIPIRSRSEKFRRRVFKKILRFTGRSYQAERIEDDDSEAYKQTLVEL